MRAALPKRPDRKLMKPSGASRVCRLTMPQDVKQLCRRYGLNYVETADLSLRRRRYGKGFGYVDGEGLTVRDKALKARIKELAIPPAWTEVCIAEDQRAHIQAVGRDAEGRLQYRYHPDWEQARADNEGRPIATSRFGVAAFTWRGKKGLVRAGARPETRSSRRWCA